MATTSSQKIKTGLFVVVGIVLLFAGIFLIGSKQNLFSSTFTVYGNFRNAGGLVQGNNIRFGGVNIGTVKGVHILSDTVVRVDMIIQSDKHEFIKTDGVASISSDGLMGDQMLVISPGSPAAKRLEDGAQIRTAEPMDFNAIIAQFTRVANNAEVITGALAGMSTQLSSGQGSIGRLLYRDDLAVGLEGTMRNAQNITGSLQSIGAQIKSGKGSIGSLVYTNELSNDIDATVLKANDAMGTIQQAAYNFSENMKALQGNFLFRGYFKKKAKAQADSVDAVQDAVQDGDDMSDEELRQLRDEADKELLRRQGTGGKKDAGGDR